MSSKLYCSFQNVKSVISEWFVGILNAISDFVTAFSGAVLWVNVGGITGLLWNSGPVCIFFLHNLITGRGHS